MKELDIPPGSLTFKVRNMSVHNYFPACRNILCAIALYIISAILFASHFNEAFSQENSQNKILSSESIALQDISLSCRLVDFKQDCRCVDQFYYEITKESRVFLYYFLNKKYVNAYTYIIKYQSNSKYKDDDILLYHKIIKEVTGIGVVCKFNVAIVPYVAYRYKKYLIDNRQL